jgi:hypothetical protein
MRLAGQAPRQAREDTETGDEECRGFIAPGLDAGARLEADTRRNGISTRMRSVPDKLRHPGTEKLANAQRLTATKRPAVSVEASGRRARPASRPLSNRRRSDHMPG